MASEDPERTDENSWLVLEGVPLSALLGDTTQLSIGPWQPVGDHWECRVTWLSPPIRTVEIKGITP